MHLLYFIGLSAILIFSNTPQEAVKLGVEPNHSTIGFAVPIAGGITKVRGKFMDFQLDMDYVDQDLTRSSVIFTIQATSINTGISDRDNHLRSKDFFEVSAYPEITFVGSAIRKSGNQYEIEGDFTMHGTTEHVTMPFKVTSQKSNTIGVSLTWRLNRKDYGVGNNFKHTSMGNFLADDIDVEVDFWTRKSKDQGN